VVELISQEQQVYLRSLEDDDDRKPRLLRLGGGGLSVRTALAGGQSSPVNAGPANFTVTFSKPVTGFTNADISFVGSTVGGTLAAAVTGGPSVYNVAVTGMTGNGIIAMSVIPGAAIDATGNPTPGSIASYVTFDTTAPSVTINQAAGQSDPAVLGPINFTVVFSEAVTGFINTDVVITGTAGGTKVVAIGGGPATYTASVTGMTTGGTVIANIPAGSATDLAGNSSTISTSTDNTVTWTPDVTPPTVTINQGASQADPTSASPILFDIVFSEAVLGFINTDVTVTFSGSGTPAVSISGAGPTYIASVTGMGTDGNVTASISAGVCTDLSGNANLASTSTDNIVAWVAPVGGLNGQLDFSNATQSGLLAMLEDI
jgi:trimeric autotransporter adhesin